MKLPNSYGSITKLTGKRRNPWCVRIACKYSLTEDSKLKETRAILGYYPTKAAALEALAEYNADPYDLSEKRLTFSEVYSKWAELKFPKVSRQSVYSYTASYKKCVDLYNIPFADIRLVHMQNIMDSNPEKSKSAANNLKILFSALYTYAMQRDIADRDYSQYVELVYKVNDTPIHKSIAEETIQNLWKQADNNDIAALILILIYTGWRISEFLDLEKIDLEQMIMQGGKKTAAGKHRIVPIHHRIQPLVRRLYSGKGQLYTMSDNTFEKSFKSILPDYHMHDTRHTFISRLQTAHADHICIERLAGHTSKGITDKVYTHKDIVELRKAIELLP